MYPLYALTAASLLDQMRRAGTLILACIGALMILSLRYFSAFGLGYEVVQLKELGVYTIGLLCAVAAFLFVLPRDEEAETAVTQLLARPVGTATLSAGAFLGRLACIGLLCALWSICIYAALFWFQWSDPRLFGYRGATSAWQEGHAVLWPVFAQWLTAAVLLAFAQPLARSGRPVAVACGLLALYALGYAAGPLGDPWARILPDLGRHDLTPGLWGGTDSGSGAGRIAHATAWCAVGLAIDSAMLRAKVAT